MRLYNTLTRKIEEFRPQDPQNVKIYTCGPTVYSDPHIGNFAAYIYWDFLTRVLTMQDFTVNRVINLTDVGHLVSDGDDGEDKLEKSARLTGEDVYRIADRYIAKFKSDYHALNLIEPALWARATDYIEQEKELVDTLTSKGFTYETSDGVYFDTSKFPRYADFAKLDLEHLQAGARVEFSSEKLHPSDFAVWKFIKPGENHAMRWDYLGRPGYPGWHLECSAIIHTTLGEPIDIHAGGIDHIPVHHTNEIAQSEAAYDTQLSRYWLHCNFITVNSEKISKSLGNVYTLADLQERGYSPLDFKMWILEGNFRSARDFTFESLESARRRRLSWKNNIALCYQGQESPTDFTPILDAASDNLGSAAAFALIDTVGAGNREFWGAVDELFGLGLMDESPNISDDIRKLLEDRAAARIAKDFARSDELRDQLADHNITVLDTPNGQVWQYLR